MPSIQERVVATGRGVRAERDLAEAAADFYVLELLTAREDAGAAKMLAAFEGSLAREFACYLDMAIGGELMDGILAKKPTFHRPKVGYDNWLSMASGPFGTYSASFAAGGKLRVEIYIDMASPADGAKALFDALSEGLGSQINGAVPEEQLSWERIDGKRASRIALYSVAPDLGDESATNAAVEWAARIAWFASCSSTLNSEAKRNP
jgi:Domain of unknown function (DUF4268)